MSNASEFSIGQSLQDEYKIYIRVYENIFLFKKKKKENSNKNN